MDRLRQGAIAGPFWPNCPVRSQPFEIRWFFRIVVAHSSSPSDFGRVAAIAAVSKWRGLAAVAIQWTDGTGRARVGAVYRNMLIELFIAAACLSWIVGGSIKSVVAAAALRVQRGEKDNRVNLNVKKYGNGPVFNDILFSVCNR
jgi:hypothetical protein